MVLWVAGGVPACGGHGAWGELEQLGVAEDLSGGCCVRVRAFRCLQFLLDWDQLSAEFVLGGAKDVGGSG